METTDFKNEFPAIVELFGHQRMAGIVSDHQFGGASFVRVDVPETLSQKGFTRLLNPSAIYALNPCERSVMLSLAETLQVKPIELWEIGTLVKAKSLANATGLDHLTLVVMKNMNKKAFKVITPAGYIYTNNASEAQTYKVIYGYPYVKNTDEETQEQPNDIELWKKL
jgi:hypothetical protein